MANLDEISDRTYVAAGADFAFVITRRGRLVTRRAPRDMSEEGRGRIVEAALSLGSQGRLGHVELPREDLVPYGGAAPIDVYFGVAGEVILCVVMPTWADRQGVWPALEHGLRAIDEAAAAASRPVVHKGHRRTRSRPRGEAPPASARRPVVEVREPPPSTRAVAAVREPSPAKRAAPPSPPARRSAVAGLVLLANGGPPRSLARPVVLRDAPPPRASCPPAPAASLPELRIGEAALGREGHAAVARALGGALSSAPEIRVGMASVGHETLAAIEAELQQPPRPGSMPEALRVELVSISRESLLEIAAEEARQAAAGPRPSVPQVRPQRLTHPWVEPPDDADVEPEAEIAGAARARRARSG
ncbi:hypothetical protein WMF26_08860 [Sorangium sp. So ce185]|uniref:hypothetical protein n=1 Tax=Sorangium sp. So ce185 TaxID=3133287 RepID=UPI003F63D8B9